MWNGRNAKHINIPVQTELHNAPCHSQIEKNSHCSADRLCLFLLYNTLK